jgi:trk system potassium uptake protein
VIVGLGDVGRELVEMLWHEPDHELVIIDLDEQRCREVASRRDGLVLHGDATDPDLLRRAQLGSADALVAASGSDAINTVIAMLGLHFGVPRIFVKLNEVNLASACAEMGVTGVVTPKISAAAEIRDGLYGLARVDLSLLARGGMRLVEVEAARARHASVGHLDLPRGALLLAVQRGTDMLFPHPDLALEDGDSLLFVAESDDVAARLRRG